MSQALPTSKLAVGLLAATTALVAPAAAQAFSPYLVVPDPAVAEASPAYRYANMTDSEAFAELDRRGAPYSKVDAAPGVRAPIRLTGRLHGVHIHSSLPPEKRAVSPFEILDARLALALDDFCALLERHDVDEVVHFTMYRPNVPAPLRPPPGAVNGARPRPEAHATAPSGLTTPALGAKGTLDRRKLDWSTTARAQTKQEDAAAKPEPGVVREPRKKRGDATPRRGTGQSPARPGGASSGTRAKMPGRHSAVPASGVSTGVRVARRDPALAGLHQTTWAPPGTRHPAGLAIDVGLLHRRDGRWLSVQHDFQGRIGAKTCGEGAPSPENPDARELRALVCEASELGLFTYVLTPDYNAEHADHFHMEIKPGVHWFLYH